MASRNRSPREEGELEDGEICDDDAEENDGPVEPDGGRPSGGSRRRQHHNNHNNHNHHQHSHNLLPLMAHHPPPQSDFRHLMPFAPHLLVPFPPSHHRQQCGPSGPDRPPPLAPPTPPLLLLPPPPGLGPGPPPPHGDMDHQRSSFWERSHSALGRYRHRAGTPGGGRDDWSRGVWGGDTGRDTADPRAPSDRYPPPGEMYGNKKDSPSRKRILFH
ncbi:hypothetical protein NHX12_003165 [Muraenolepis orangiensis]|uniref:Uncharacterized protein n=1 Tax=Muraenolepis orangiensis TaxID=630683 RepID=A0A9Q0DVY3_9TELE|nr:hypothetical protein NHX12_003165 [Muraenolepis orangiensis]